jgi:hypothetical protein
MLLVGPALQAELGGVGFLALYLAGGVLANLVAYAWNCSWRRRRRWTFQVGRPPRQTAQAAPPIGYTGTVWYWRWASEVERSHGQTAQAARPVGYSIPCRTPTLYLSSTCQVARPRVGQRRQPARCPARTVLRDDQY